MTNINDYHRYNCRACGRRMKLVQWCDSIFANCPKFCTYNRLTLADLRDIIKQAYMDGYCDGKESP